MCFIPSKEEEDSLAMDVYKYPGLKITGVSPRLQKGLFRSMFLREGSCIVFESAQASTLCFFWYLQTRQMDNENVSSFECL